jgi:hypothetical protein
LIFAAKDMLLSHAEAILAVPERRLAVAEGHSDAVAA